MELGSKWTKYYLGTNSIYCHVWIIFLFYFTYYCYFINIIMHLKMNLENKNIHIQQNPVNTKRFTRKKIQMIGKSKYSPTCANIIRQKKIIKNLQFSQSSENMIWGNIFPWKYTLMETWIFSRKAFSVWTPSILKDA